MHMEHNEQVITKEVPVKKGYYLVDIEDYPTDGWGNSNASLKELLEGSFL